MSKQEADGVTLDLLADHGAANGWLIAQSIIGLLITDGFCVNPMPKYKARLSIQTTEALQDEEWRRYAESPLTS